MSDPFEEYRRKHGQYLQAVPEAATSQARPRGASSRPGFGRAIMNALEEANAAIDRTMRRDFAGYRDHPGQQARDDAERTLRLARGAAHGVIDAPLLLLEGAGRLGSKADRALGIESTGAATRAIHSARESVGRFFGQGGTTGYDTAGEIAGGFAGLGGAYGRVEGAVAKAAMLSPRVAAAAEGTGRVASLARLARSTGRAGRFARGLAGNAPITAALELPDHEMSTAHLVGSLLEGTDSPLARRVGGVLEEASQSVGGRAVTGLGLDALFGGLGTLGKYRGPEAVRAGEVSQGRTRRGRGLRLADQAAEAHAATARATDHVSSPIDRALDVADEGPSPEVVSDQTLTPQQELAREMAALEAHRPEGRVSSDRLGTPDQRLEAAALEHAPEVDLIAAAAARQVAPPDPLAEAAAQAPGLGLIVPGSAITGERVPSGGYRPPPESVAATPEELAATRGAPFEVPVADAWTRPFEEAPLGVGERMLPPPADPATLSDPQLAAHIHQMADRVRSLGVSATPDSEELAVARRLLKEGQDVWALRNNQALEHADRVSRVNPTDDVRVSPEEQAAVRGAQTVNIPLTDTYVRSGQPDRTRRLLPSVTPSTVQDERAAAWRPLVRGERQVGAGDTTFPRTRDLTRPVPTVPPVETVAVSVGEAGRQRRPPPVEASVPSAAAGAEAAWRRTLVPASQEGWRGVDPGSLNPNAPRLDRTKGAPLPLPEMVGVEVAQVQRAWNDVSSRYPRLARVVRRVKAMTPKMLETGGVAGYSPKSGTLWVRPGAELEPSSLFHEITHTAQAARRLIGPGINVDAEIAARMEAYAYRTAEAARARSVAAAEALPQEAVAIDAGATRGLEEGSGMGEGVPEVPAQTGAVERYAAVDVNGNRIASGSLADMEDLAREDDTVRAVVRENKFGDLSDEVVGGPSGAGAVEVVDTGLPGNLTDEAYNALHAEVSVGMGEPPRLKWKRLADGTHEAELADGRLVTLTNEGDRGDPQWVFDVDGVGDPNIASTVSEAKQLARDTVHEHAVDAEVERRAAGAATAESTPTPEAQPVAEVVRPESLLPDAPEEIAALTRSGQTWELNGQRYQRTSRGWKRLSKNGKPTGNVLSHQELAGAARVEPEALGPAEREAAVAAISPAGPVGAPGDIHGEVAPTVPPTDPLYIHHRATARDITDNGLLVERALSLARQAEKVARSGTGMVPEIAASQARAYADEVASRGLSRMGGAGIHTLTAITGAGFGAAAGYASAEDGDRVRGAIQGALMGLVGGYATPALARRALKLEGVRPWNPPHRIIRSEPLFRVISDVLTSRAGATIASLADPGRTATLAIEDGKYVLTEQLGEEVLRHEFEDLFPALRNARQRGYNLPAIPQLSAGPHTPPWHGLTQEDLNRASEIADAAATMGLRTPPPNPRRAPKAESLPLPPLHPDLVPEAVEPAWRAFSARYPRIAARIEGIDALPPHLGRVAQFDAYEGTIAVVIDNPAVAPGVMFHEGAHAAQNARRQVFRTPEDMLVAEHYAQRVQRAYDRELGSSLSLRARAIGGAAIGAGGGYATGSSDQDRIRRAVFYGALGLAGGIVGPGVAGSALRVLGNEVGAVGDLSSLIAENPVGALHAEAKAYADEAVERGLVAGARRNVQATTTAGAAVAALVTHPVALKAQVGAAAGALAGQDEDHAVRNALVGAAALAGGVAALKGLRSAGRAIDAISFILPRTWEGAGRKTESLVRIATTARGDLPAATHLARIEGGGRTERLIRGGKYILRDFDRAAKEAYGGIKYMTEAEIEQVDLAFKGAVPVSALPAQIQPHVTAFRDYVDSLTETMINEGVVSGPMAAAFDANKGFYARRSYQVFDDPAWAHKVDPAVKNRAEGYLRAEFPGYSDEQIQGALNELLYRNEGGPMAFLAQHPGLSKSLGIVTERKDIAPEIRALWGEYGDARVNFMRSVADMSDMIGKHQVLSETRASGLGTWLHDQPVVQGGESYHALISGEGSEALAPLNGLYTTPEIKAALTQAFGHKESNPWLRGYMKVVGAVKVAKTVGSVQATLRNFVSNVGFAMAQGLLNKEAVGAVVGGAVGAETGDSTGSMVAGAIAGAAAVSGARRLAGKAPRITDAFRMVAADLAGSGPKAVPFQQRYQRYLELGVVSGGTQQGELQAVLKDASQRGYAALYSPVQGVTQRGLQAASTVYRLGDDVWKIYHFEGELARYRQAMPNLSVPELEKRVADVVRRTHTYYDMVPGLVRGLRRAPMVGTFVSFPAEVVRIGKNTVKLIAEEMADPATRGIAMQRAFGVLAAAAIPVAAGVASRNMAGVTPKQEEAMRHFLPPWDENAQLIHLGRDARGRMRYVNVGFTNPWSYWTEPVLAVMRGDETWQQKADDVGRSMLQPFVGEDILTSAVMDVARNKNADTGKEVFNPQAPAGRRLGQVGGHLWKTLEPGTVTSAKRIYKGATGQESASGRSYNLNDELVSVSTGQRRQLLDPSQSLGFQVSRWQDDMQHAEKILNSTLRDRGRLSTEDVASAYQDTEASRQKLFDEMHQSVVAAQMLGVSRAQVYQMLRGAQVNKAMSSALLVGRYQPYRPSEEMVQGIQRSFQLSGRGGEFRERVGTVRRASMDRSRRLRVERVATP